MREWRRAATFGAVGVANTLVDVAAFAALLWAGLPLLAANTLGFVAGAANSYVMNGLVTFRDRGADLRAPRTMARFAAVTLTTLAISNLVVWAGAQVAPVWVAKALSIGATFVVGFALNRALVFRAAP
jgi:putative flippase GtrA